MKETGKVKQLLPVLRLGSSANDSPESRVQVDRELLLGEHAPASDVMQVLVVLQQDHELMSVAVAQVWQHRRIGQVTCSVLILNEPLVNNRGTNCQRRETTLQGYVLKCANLCFNFCDVREEFF